MDYGYVYPIAGAEEDLADRAMRWDAEKQDAEWQDRIVRNLRGWKALDESDDECIHSGSNWLSKNLGHNVRYLSSLPSSREERLSIKRSIQSLRRSKTKREHWFTWSMLGSTERRVQRILKLRRMSGMPY